MKYGGIFHGKYMYFIEHVWKILENMVKNIGKYWKYMYFIENIGKYGGIFHGKYHLVI
jgi:hypothetical protein